MPIWEYKCGVCEKQFERLFLQRPPSKDLPIARCPDCGGVAERIISKSNIRFWGGGWDKPNSRKNW